MYDIPALILWVETTVYGNYDCLLTACHSQAIGVTSSDAIPDGSFSASSKVNNVRGPSAGRLNGNNRGRGHQKLILITLTTYKLTCSMIMLSVL